MPVGAVLGEYLRTMRREVGLACRGALLRQLTEQQAVRLGGVRLVRPTEPQAVIPVAGCRSVDDWSATMPRKRRQNLRKIDRVVTADPTVEVSVVPAAEADPLEVVAVLRHNESKYQKGLLAPLPRLTGYLAALLRQPDVLLGRYTDPATGQLRAVVTILDHPRWPVTRHWSAVPDDRADRPNLYLHHYRTVVDWAIGAGREGLLVGRGMAELKQSLGADLVPQFAAVVPMSGRGWRGVR